MIGRSLFVALSLAPTKLKIKDFLENEPYFTKLTMTKAITFIPIMLICPLVKATLFSLPDKLLDFCLHETMPQYKRSKSWIFCKFF